MQNLMLVGGFSLVEKLGPVYVMTPASAKFNVVVIRNKGPVKFNVVGDVQYSPSG
jgi:hypothetical protein